jgi:hypothetical protein
MPSRTPNITVLHDTRVGCWSVLTGMRVSEYLGLVVGAYKNRGGIRGQRDPLKTTTGRRIRARMIEDITLGAVLPPVVIGIVTDADLNALVALTVDEIVDRIVKEWIDDISIIDGMQRTTALLEAVERHEEVGSHIIRVEIWLARSADSLIYRMLVLNSGQVPWTIKRQLQVVYSPLLEEMKKHVHFERLLSLEKTGRRFKGGEFSADSLVEAYIAFGLRRTEIDAQESIADEFSRLDIADAIMSKKYDRFFYAIVQILVDLDKAFSRLDTVADAERPDDSSLTSKFKIGRNIFDSQPARIGFVVACSLAVLGRLGMDKQEAESETALKQLRNESSELIESISKMNEEELSSFLALDVLSEKLSGQKRSAVGRHERSFFETAFKVLIEVNFRVPSLEVCWRA